MSTEQQLPRDDLTRTIMLFEQQPGGLFLPQWWRGTNGAAHVQDGFRPSAYGTDLTMDGTAQSVALASGIKLGAGRIRVTNRGGTTEAIRLAFGTSAANAEANLNVDVGGFATTGIYIGSPTDGYSPPPPFGVDALATHYAVANAVAADVQVVSIEQGV